MSDEFYEIPRTNQAWSRGIIVIMINRITIAREANRVISSKRKSFWRTVYKLYCADVM